MHGKVHSILLKPRRLLMAGSWLNERKKVRLNLNFWLAIGCFFHPTYLRDKAIIVL